MNKISRYRPLSAMMTKSYIDPLTQLPNRCSFSRSCKTLLAASLDGVKTTVLMIDIDDLGVINSTFGTDVGDQVIQCVADLLSTALSVHSDLYRYNSDCFAIVAYLDEKSEAKCLAQQCINAMKTMIGIGSSKFRVSVSVGIAGLEFAGQSLEQAASFAESALKRAQAHGGGRYVMFTQSMFEAEQLQMRIHNQIPEALKNYQFRVAYQPVIDFRTHEIVRAEALLRWTSPVLGDVYPDQFIPVAEKTGDIIALGDWVCRESCRISKVLQEVVSSSIKVSFNVSPLQLIGSNVAATLLDAADYFDVDPSMLAVELTESAGMEDSVYTHQQFEAFKHYNVGIYLDDFGTGFSALSHLTAYPFDAIKIDRSFVAQLEENEQVQRLVTSIITLGQSLNMKVIAEGVETVAQAEFLFERGCYLFQGYLFYKPLEEAEFIEAVRVNQALSAFVREDSEAFSTVIKDLVNSRIN